jgi:hypothetical protein
LDVPDDYGVSNWAARSDFDSNPSSIPTVKALTREGEGLFVSQSKLYQMTTALRLFVSQSKRNHDTVLCLQGAIRRSQLFLAGAYFRRSTSNAPDACLVISWAGPGKHVSYFISFFFIFLLFSFRFKNGFVF